ncbi:uncharacterized protein [Scyliorhinus torazame]|uniref:uncharacterized protein n=1 Tax=Scyliorhinus torazame TaxID=75743 RepID=UPI003B598B5C
MSAIMFQSSEFLRAAEKMPLLFEISHFHLLETIDYVDKFISMVKDSQSLLESSCSLLWTIHRTQESMVSMFVSLCDALDSGNTRLLMALPKEMMQWTKELLEKFNQLKEGWRAFDNELNALWKSINKLKIRMTSDETTLMVDCMLELNPEIPTHLEQGAQYMSQAASQPQDILHFFQKVGCQLQDRNQEWRKILFLLNCEDPGIKQTIKQAEENWLNLSSACKTVTTEFEDRGIYEIYKVILNQDPRRLSRQELQDWEGRELARINLLNSEASQ